jgi:3-phosphoshikimate 1-carboxyvinyltransferase
MTGLLAGQPFDSVLTGDESLSSRPMRRVITPLERMGAHVESRNGCPPLRISGGRALAGMEYAMPVASAQVKSAVLLAGLYASGTTAVTEPAVTRDHTERMLRAMGVAVSEDGARVAVAGGQRLRGTAIEVPADLSSATFVILAALLADDADILITNVGVNPSRTGVIAILASMGADIGLENERTLGDEPVADVRVRSGTLAGRAIDPSLVSLAIDEFPALFVAAAAARPCFPAWPNSASSKATGSPPWPRASRRSASP